MDQENVKITMQKPRISLFDLLKGEKPIWVKNTTHLISKKRNSGPMTLQIHVGDTKDKLVIPQGNDPICLSDLTTYDSLKNCVDLQRAINKGGLELLDPDQAEEYYKVHENRKQIVADKLLKYKNMPKQNPNIPELAVQQQTPKTPDKDMINVRMQMNCNRLKQGNLAEDAFLEDLVENQYEYKVIDLNYIIENVEQTSIKNWAKDTLKLKLEE